MANFPARQLRTCVMPVRHLVDYIDRRTGKIPNARIHHLNAETSTGRVFLYLETHSHEIQPLTIDVPWHEVFGEVVCPVTGKKHFVDEVTVSAEGHQRLKDRITQLEQFIVDSGLIPPLE